MKIYTDCDFKEMPWKNGGGVTTELFCKRDQNNEILFRLSKANVSSDGPFSFFPNLRRVLLLLSGNGFKLTGTTTKKNLTLDSEALYFSGEEAIHCELISGPCIDFNVMVNQSMGEATAKKLLFLNQAPSDSPRERFIYLTKKNLLIHLLPNELLQNVHYSQEECILIEITSLHH